MATEGYVKFEYFSKGVPPFYNSGGFPELLDDEKITIESPCLELNYHQYASMFKKFLMALGFDQKNVIQAGCSIAFSEMNNEKLMREVAEEYELIMSEDLPDIIQDKIKQDAEWVEKHDNSWEQRYWALYRRFNKFARFTDEQLEEMASKTMTPKWHSYMEALKYTDDELDAMCDKAASDEEKRKCQEYNLREAEYYNKRAELDATQKVENTVCDKDNPSDECKEHWNNFWDSETPLADKVQEGYNYWEEDVSDKGVMKVATNDPMLGWNGYIPGTPAAQAVGCICPVLDNEEMPNDVKWIDVECPIHGRKK
jgi:hypothetical protein